MEKIINKDWDPPKLLIETNKEEEKFFQNSELYWEIEEHNKERPEPAYNPNYKEEFLKTLVNKL